MLNCIKTEVKVTQWTSRPPRIDGHIKMLDLNLLNDENWIRESQDMCFHRHAKLTKNSNSLNLGELVFIFTNTPLEVTQLAFRQPRIKGHLQKVDHCLSNYKNRIRET